MRALGLIGFLVVIGVICVMLSQVILPHTQQVIRTQKKLDPQADGKALNGGFAPKWWQKGDVVAGDTYTFALPADFPPGKYTLKFGLYNKDGARMPAFDTNGQPINDAAISVPIEIK